MTPAELEALTLEMKPGLSRWKRAQSVADLVERKRRVVLYWFAGSVAVPHWAEEKIVAEHRRWLRNKVDRNAN